MSDERTPAEIGAEIKALREAASLSQEQLAHMVGTNQQTVQRIETGATAHSRATPKIFQALRHIGLREASSRDPIAKTYIGAFDMLEMKRAKVEPIGIRKSTEVYKNINVMFSSEVEPGLIKLDKNISSYIDIYNVFSGNDGMYGLYNSASDMIPEFEHGDTIIIDPRVPPISNVTCLFIGNEKVPETATIKRLVFSDKEFWRVKRWSPEKDFDLSKQDWPICHRVIGKVSRR